MNNFKLWFQQNRLPATFGGIFLFVTLLLGVLTYISWSNYGAASADRADTISKMEKLSKQTPPPTEANLALVTKTFEAENESYQDLLKRVSTYRIPALGNLDKTKPQEAPRLFQDALRAEVTKIRALGDSSGSKYSPTFYLGLEDYENRLPQPAEVDSLSRQLTVLVWLSKQMLTHQGLNLLEFSKDRPPALSKSAEASAKKQPETAKPDQPWQSLSAFKITFESDQAAFRDVINALSHGPYFLIVESLQVQNSAKTPPSRQNAAPAEGTPAPDSQAATAADGTKRQQVVVGREKVDVSLKVRIFDFPPQQAPTPAK
jgi:hypothetical protein